MDNKSFDSREKNFSQLDDGVVNSLGVDVPAFAKNDPKETLRKIDDFSVSMAMSPSLVQEQDTGEKVDLNKNAIGSKILHIVDDGKIDDGEVREIERLAASDPALLNAEVDEISKKMRGQN